MIVRLHGLVPIAFTAAFYNVVVTEYGICCEGMLSIPLAPLQAGPTTHLAFSGQMPDDWGVVHKAAITGAGGAWADGTVTGGLDPPGVTFDEFITANLLVRVVVGNPPV